MQKNPISAPSSRTETTGNAPKPLTQSKETISRVTRRAKAGRKLNLRESKVGIDRSTQHQQATDQPTKRPSQESNLGMSDQRRVLQWGQRSGRHCESISPFPRESARESLSPRPSPPLSLSASSLARLGVSCRIYYEEKSEAVSARWRGN